MNVLAINASPRRDGNTAALVRRVFQELEKQGIATRLEHLGKARLSGCTACYECFKRLDRRCAVTRDAMNGLIEKMLAADGIILASPTYFADVTANMHAVIERAGLVARANQSMFARKVGAGVVALRRSGGMQAFNSLNAFFMANQMVVPGGGSWNLGFGWNVGDVRDDQEGMEAMGQLGRNMAWLLGKLHD